MYTHCLHCTRALSSNRELESLHVGSRLAFSELDGRLWVICSRCQRWNLCTIEERWEAVEECARLFRATPQRFSTDQIGLATRPSGLELVRIGSATAGEFAAWRYGRVLRQRRSTSWVRRGIERLFQEYSDGGAYSFGAVLLVGVVLALVGVAPLIALIPVWGTGGYLMFKELQPLVELEQHGAMTRLRRLTTDVFWAHEPDQSWRLVAYTFSGKIVVAGENALDVLRRVLVHLAWFGGSDQEVSLAIRKIAAQGGPAGFLDSIAKRYEGGQRLRDMSTLELLALEIACHEEAERRTFCGELAVLENHARDAAHVAAIADDLLVPAHIRARLADLSLARKPSSE